MQKDLSEMTIPELVALEVQARAFIDVAVMTSRRSGSTWAAIAAELGVSHQEAHRRYAHRWAWMAASEGLTSPE